jgi:hypothetical protein
MSASRYMVYGLAALILAAIGLAMATVPPASQVRLETILRENAYLVARQDALRRKAFDLADELYRQVEHDRLVLVHAGEMDPSWNLVHAPPRPREAGNDVILAWLSEQSSRIQTLPPEPAARP